MTGPVRSHLLSSESRRHRYFPELLFRLGQELDDVFGRRDDRDRIDYATRLAFGRPATKEEIRTGIEYLEQCRAALRETNLPNDRQPRSALASYTRVLFSSNEFMYLD